MIYGQPPLAFQPEHLTMYQKVKAIPDLACIINFAEYAVPCLEIRPPEKLEHLKWKVRVTEAM